MSGVDTRTVTSDLVSLRAATEYVTALAFGGALPEPPEDIAAIKEVIGIHGVGPYLGMRVAAGEISPAEPLASWLIEQVSRNRERLTRLRAELTTTLDALEQRGFEAMPLKGGAMLLESVEAVVWRSFSDLDLLTPNTDGRMQDLDLALAQAGYCLGGRSWKHRCYSACAPGPPLVIGDGEHPDNPRDVEVHEAVVEMFRGFSWDLTPYLLAEPNQRDDRPVPSDRAMALHLAVHASIAALEGTARAINLIDLARQIARVGPMPVYLAVRDAGLNAHARFVYPAIALAARETGEVGCRELQRMLSACVPARMVEWADTVSLYHISWAGRHDRPSLDRHDLWARTSAERARMLAHTLLPSPAILASERDGTAKPIDLVRGYVLHYRRLAGRMLGDI